MTSTQKLLTGLCLMLTGLLMLAPTLAADEPTESGTITFTVTSIGALGADVEWGSGTLEFQGEQHSFSLKGVGAGAIGPEKAEGNGKVYNLNDIADFPGTYTVTEAGLTVGGGEKDVNVQNDKGVYMVLSVETEGLAARLAAEAVTVTMD